MNNCTGIDYTVVAGMIERVGIDDVIDVLNEIISDPEGSYLELSMVTGSRTIRHRHNL